MVHYVAGQRRRVKRSAAAVPSAPQDAELVQLARAQRDAQENTSRTVQIIAAVLIVAAVWVVLAIVFSNLA